jgi:hypothetical protein
MLLTALPPAPPTPTTAIRGFRSGSTSGIDNLIVIPIPLQFYSSNMPNFSLQVASDFPEDAEISNYV